jgi:hypothetical protein
VFLKAQGGLHIRDFLLTHDVQHLKDLLDHMLEQPEGFEKLCLWLKLGAERYAPFNWTKGMPLSRCIDSMGRHMLAMYRGLTDELHDAALMCNLMFVIHYCEEIEAGRLPNSWYDLWDYETRAPRVSGAPKGLTEADKGAAAHQADVVRLRAVMENHWATCKTNDPAYHPVPFEVAAYYHVYPLKMVLDMVILAIDASNAPSNQALQECSAVINRPVCFRPLDTKTFSRAYEGYLRQHGYNKSRSSDPGGDASGCSTVS